MMVTPRAANADDIDRLWEELREMESRINGRLDRMGVDAADRHASNVERLSRLEQFYWQGVGIGKFSRFLWGLGGAMIYSLAHFLWWLKDHLK